MITRHHEDLWSLRLPLSMMGIAMGARSTIARLPDGGLVVISPGPFQDEHFDAIRGIGEVRALVAPNKFHHLFLGRAAKAFPNAQVFLAPGLRKRIPSLPPGEDLGDDAPALWSGTIDQAIVAGSAAGEVVFHHEPSRTLIVTDLAFNLTSGGPWTRLAMMMNGGFGELSTTRLMRSTIRDPDAFARALHAMKRWDFDRLIVAHGDVVETNARTAFERAFARWLDRLPSASDTSAAT